MLANKRRPRIVVKKPFIPEEVLKSLVKYEGKKHEEHDKPDEKTERKVNPEFEEKPVTPPTSKSSEDTHGGEELTFSMQTQQQGGESSEDSEKKKSGLSESSEKESSEKEGGQDREQQGGESSEEEGEEGKQDKEQESGGESLGGESGREEDHGGDSAGGSEAQDADAGMGEQEGEEDFGEASGNEDEDEGSQQTPSVFNVEQVVDVTEKPDDDMYYQTEFHRFIEMISEEKTKVFDSRTADEYNIRKMMFRQYERKPLEHYKQSRVKDTVVLILDNSGSMIEWAENLQVLADLALKRKDVVIYIAPNGYISERLTQRGLVKVNHNSVVKQLKGRKIIYVGDYDGGNTPIELSWYNDVIWVCPETRYRRFKSHDWVKYNEDQFHGVFVRAYTLDEMFDAFKKILSKPFAYKLWLDYHEDEVFSDDQALRSRVV